MEREVRRFLWGCILAGCVFGVALGAAAGDRDMVIGVLAAAVGGLIVAPLAARLWR